MIHYSMSNANHTLTLKPNLVAPCTTLHVHKSIVVYVPGYVEQNVVHLWMSEYNLLAATVATFGGTICLCGNKLRPI